VSLIIEPFNYSFETLICILLINSFFDTKFWAYSYRIKLQVESGFLRFNLWE